MSEFGIFDFLFGSDREQHHQERQARREQRHQEYLERQARLEANRAAYYGRVAGNVQRYLGQF